jgi:hypothetical protein
MVPAHARGYHRTRDGPVGDGAVASVGESASSADELSARADSASGRGAADRRV